MPKLKCIKNIYKCYMEPIEEDGKFRYYNCGCGSTHQLNKFDNTWRDVVLLPKRKCKRCDHEWFLKKPVEPLVCPKCKSPYWNKEKKNEW